MTKPAYFRWVPAEAEADEDWRLMDEAQIGLFMVLLNYGWSNNGLPKKPDDIWRAIPLKITLERFTQLWQGIVENKFPVATDGRRRNHRQEVERSLALDVSAKRSYAAKLRHSKESDHEGALAEDLQREGAHAPHYNCNYSLDLSSSFPEKKGVNTDRRSKLDIEFEDIFWPCVWLKVGKDAARKAYWKARKKHRGQLICDAAKLQGASLIEAANRAQRTAVYPATWLNEGRFLDEDFATLPPLQGVTKKPARNAAFLAAIAEDQKEIEGRK